MPNYVLAQESNRANIPDRLWYAMEETDLEDIAANENIATGDKVYVIKQGKTYIFGEDSEWYVSGKSSGGGGTSVDVEPLAVNANGTYTAAEGTAYSPVTVDVPQTTVESLAVAANGTYTAQAGKAYSPVMVNVAAVNKLSQVTDASITEITAADLDGITIMRDRAFYQCTRLESVELPATLTKISNYAFNACMSLKRVIIPEGIEQIGQNCFTATQLSEVVLPSSITSIGNSAFLSNYSLVSVIVRATTPPTLGTNAFNSSHSDLVIYVPAGSVSAYQSATNWSTYADRIQAIPA